VTSVQGDGPAARVGITAGDMITAINGQPINAPTDVSQVLATLEPGQTVPVAITKTDGSHGKVNVKLGQYPGTGTG
jgi:putative serine protease PepD